MATEYCIEIAAYGIPVPGESVWKFLGVLPAHLFFALSKEEADGQLMPITTLHALSTRFIGDRKEILGIGTRSSDRLVMYQIFNNRGYTQKIQNNPEAAEEIRQIMQSEKAWVGLTEQEEAENKKAADPLSNNRGENYFLPLTQRMVVYGRGKREEHAFELWSVLNDFKNAYNENPGYYPLYGVGASFFTGEPPKNSNTGFTTLALMMGAPLHGFAPFWTPGLGGTLSDWWQLQPWIERCKTIKMQAPAPVVSEVASNLTANSNSSVLDTRPSSASASAASSGSFSMLFDSQHVDSSHGDDNNDTRNALNVQTKPDVFDISDEEEEGWSVSPRNSSPRG